MRLWRLILCILAFTVCDLTVTTVLYVYSCKEPSVVQDFLHFTVFHSMLDVWGTSLLRICISLGAVIGTARNRTQGPRRLQASGTPMALVCYLIATYGVIKLLLFSEAEKPVRDPWFWSLLTWTWLSSAVTLWAWRRLGRVTPGRERSGLYSPLTGDQEGAQERRQKQEAESRVSGATVGRLLSYSKQDAGYLTAAFIFLLLCTVGETFSPYYTGLVIDGIVVQRSLKQFSSAVVILSVLAVGSSFSAGVRGGLFTFTFARLNIRIRNRLFRSLLAQEIGFFDENHTGQFLLLAKEVQTALAKANNIAEETISAMKTVRSFANEEAEVALYGEKLQRVYALYKKEAVAYTCYSWSTGNVSFTLDPGKVTALVGPSGSGKSSCVNILENFYLVQDGEVLLDGKPITLYEHKYLHTKVSMVSQEPVLFARSIQDNVAYGLNSVPLEPVVNACVRASAHAFIMELQDGYNTGIFL
ncbi:hypothetical protein FKM82_005059 [Ascaphus truei]